MMLVQAPTVALSFASQAWDAQWFLHFSAFLHWNQPKSAPCFAFLGRVAEMNTNQPSTGAFDSWGPVSPHLLRGLHAVNSPVISISKQQRGKNDASRSLPPRLHTHFPQKSKVTGPAG